MAGFAILAVTTALSATPPLPVPPARLSAPMSKVDLGGATIVFPHGARNTPRPTAAEAEAIRQRRLSESPLPPKLVEEAVALMSRSDAWTGSDPTHAESYTVLVGPRPSTASDVCPRTPQPGYSCQTAHVGAARGKLVRRELGDGSIIERMTLYTATQAYNVSYTLFGPSARTHLPHAAPGDLATGERFIRSFRLAGQPVVLAPATH